MKALPVKFGVELEFVGPGIKYCRHLLTKKLGIPAPSRRAGIASTDTWTLAIDPSVFSDNRNHEDFHEDRFAVELRTPIMTPDQLPKMRRVLDMLSPVCFITKSCGMHVHLSTPEAAVLDYAGMAKHLWRLYGKSVWKQRLHYCNRGTTEDNEDYGWDEKYRAVNVVDGAARHIEYRLFNGTLDYKTVADRVRVSIDCFRRFMRVGDLNGYGRPYDRSRSRRLANRVVSVPSNAVLEQVIVRAPRPTPRLYTLQQ